MIQEELVVLHTTDYSETSLIVHAYSKHRGPLTFLVKGAKKIQKKAGGVFLHAIPSSIVVPKQKIRWASFV